VYVGVIREGAETTTFVVLGESPPPLQSETATTIEVPVSRNGAIDLGLTLAPASALASGEKDNKYGVVVLAIRPDRLGAGLDLNPGDIILDVGGKSVETPEEFREALHDAHAVGRPATLMRLKSRDTTRFIAVPLDSA
jgi:serine protease Do